MKRVFVDTSAFFAHLVAKGAHHAEAIEQLGITEALAFDDDFRSYGKIVLVR